MQNTAYEINLGLVGSEICIKDRPREQSCSRAGNQGKGFFFATERSGGFLYTSDAAVEEDSVKVGGRGYN